MIDKNTTTFRVYGALRHSPEILGVPVFLLLGIAFITGIGFFIIRQAFGYIVGFTWLGIGGAVYGVFAFLQTQDPMFLSILYIRLFSKFGDELCAFIDSNVNISWRK